MLLMLCQPLKGVSPNILKHKNNKLHSNRDDTGKNTI